MNEIFFDLLQTPELTIPVFGLTLLMGGVLMAVVYYSRGVQEEAEPVVEPERDEYLAALIDALPDTPPTSQERMRVIRPHASVRPAWLEKLLNHYQFWMTLDADGGVAVLTDRRFFNLKNRNIEVPFGEMVSADDKAMGKLLGRARFNINRRAQAAGLLVKKTRKQEGGQ